MNSRVFALVRSGQMAKKAEVIVRGGTTSAFGWLLLAGLGALSSWHQWHRMHRLAGGRK